MTDDKQEAVVFLKNGERVIIPDIQHWFCDMGNENIIHHRFFDSVKE